jgi:hypothetical protein
MSAAPPPAPRTTAQRADLVVGIVLTLINLLLGTVMLPQIAQLSALSAICEGVQPDGTRCDPTFLNVVIIIGFAIVIFAGFLGTGALIVRAIRRRVVFWIPLVTGVAILAAFYVVAALLGTSYQPAA